MMTPDKLAMLFNYKLINDDMIREVAQQKYPDLSSTSITVLHITQGRKGHSPLPEISEDDCLRVDVRSSSELMLKLHGRAVEVLTKLLNPAAAFSRYDMTCPVCDCEY